MRKGLLICSLLVAMACYSQNKPGLKLPQIIRDSMILQRDARIKIWGWAATGEKVTIRFNEKKYNSKAGYAWADSPPSPNLFNKEGLPASPFRTDNF